MRLRFGVPAFLYLLLVLFTPAWAADNSTLPVSVGTEVFANKDIAGVKFPKSIPYNSSGTELFTSGNPGQIGAPASAFADGSSVTQGAKADAACGSDNGTCSLAALIKRTNQNLTTLNTTAGAAVAAGSNIIGKMGIDQTTPGTTNGVQVNAALPAGTNNIGKVDRVSQYPASAVPYTASATGTTGATTATLTGAASVTTYICGFSIRANATAAATGNATVTGTITGTLNFTQWTAPTASGLGVTEMIFAPCVPASATNTSVAIVSAAPGTGGVVSVTAWGYKL